METELYCCRFAGLYRALQGLQGSLIGLLKLRDMAEALKLTWFNYNADI